MSVYACVHACVCARVCSRVCSRVLNITHGFMGASVCVHVCVCVHTCVCRHAWMHTCSEHYSWVCGCMSVEEAGAGEWGENVRVRFLGIYFIFIVVLNVPS